MRTLEYRRFQMHRPHPEKVRGTLADLVLEVPGLLPCGVVPPLHILNDVLTRGRSGVGMSPGVGWEPFTIDAEEYAELVEDLLTAPTTRLTEERDRWYPETILTDDALARYKAYLPWFNAVQDKYGEKPASPPR